MPRLRRRPLTGLRADELSRAVTMTTRRALQLCVCLAVLRPSLPAAGPAPHVQVAVLTQGLLRLLAGVTENGRAVERQGAQAAQELRRHARELSRLRRRAGRLRGLWAGLRRELQAGVARGEGLRRGAEALRELDGWGALERRLSRVRELVQAFTAPGTGDVTPLNITLLQAKMEAQGRRLSDLSQELMIQDGVVAQQDQHIAELQASESREELQSFI